MSLQNSPTPYYPDLQNLSAAFSASGVISVNTKYRQVTGVYVQPLFTNSTINTLGAAYAISVSANKGIVTAQLLNASTQISGSGYGVNIWTVGVM